LLVAGRLSYNDFNSTIVVLDRMVIEMRYALWVSTLVLLCISGLAFSAEYEYGNKALQIWDDHASVGTRVVKNVGDHLLIWFVFYNKTRGSQMDGRRCFDRFAFL